MNTSKWKISQINTFNENWYWKKNRFAFSKRFEMIHRILSRITPKSILDIGTGDGEMLLRLINSQNLNASCYGIDLSAELIQIASKIIKKHAFSETIHFLVADSENLPFRNRVFESITCSAVLEHVLDLESSLKEMSRVCKKNKYVIITIPNALYYYFFQLLALLRLRYKDSSQSRNLKLEQVEKIMRDIDLKLIFRLNFVLPIPKAFKFISKIFLRWSSKRLHPFLNQLLIVRKQ